MKLQICIMLFLVSAVFALRSQTLGQKTRSKEERKSGFQVNSENQKYYQMIQTSIKHHTKVKNQHMQELLNIKNRNNKVQEGLDSYGAKNLKEDENEASLQERNILMQVSDQERPLSLIQIRLNKLSKKCLCDPHSDTKLLNKVECPCQNEAKVNCPCQNKAKVDCPCQNKAKVDCPCQNKAKVDCPCQNKAKVDCPCGNKAKVDCPCSEKSGLQSQLLQVDSKARSENADSSFKEFLDN